MKQPRDVSVGALQCVVTSRIVLYDVHPPPPSIPARRSAPSRWTAPVGGASWGGRGLQASRPAAAGCCHVAVRCQRAGPRSAATETAFACPFPLARASGGRGLAPLPGRRRLSLPSSLSHWLRPPRYRREAPFPWRRRWRRRWARRAAGGCPRLWISTNTVSSASQPGFPPLPPPAAFFPVTPIFFFPVTPDFPQSRMPVTATRRRCSSGRRRGGTSCSRHRGRTGSRAVPSPYGYRMGGGGYRHFTAAPPGNRVAPPADLRGRGAARARGPAASLPSPGYRRTAGQRRAAG